MPVIRSAARSKGGGRRPRLRALLLVMVAFTALGAAGYLFATRLPAPAGEMSAIPGSVSPGIASAQRLAPVPAQGRMTIAVVMRVQRANGSKKMVSISSAGREVRAFLTDNKLNILSGLETVDSLLASGSVQDVQSTFRVHLYTWRQQGSKRIFFANDGPIAIPSRLATSVVGVLGLDDYPVALSQVAPSRPSGLSDRLLSPQQMQRAYGLSSLLASSSCNRSACDGTGQGVAIYAQGGFYLNDVTDFSAQWGLNTPNLVVRSWIPSQSRFMTTSLDPAHDVNEGEAELDIEAVHSLAPGATIHVYEFPESSVTGTGDTYYASVALTYGAFFSAVLNSVDRDPDNVLSISFGDCESGFSISELLSLDQELHDVALDGRTVLVASGDDGRYCGATKNNTVIGPNFPASDPSVTGVGGTSLTAGPDGSYPNEAAWDTGRWQSSPGAGASGASFKSLFLPQTWQASLGLGGKNRLVPDVAAVADPNADTLAIFAYCGPLRIGRITLPPNTNCWQPGGGTSLAAPLWAGFVAVYNQYAQSHGEGTLGFANPVLYYLASHPHQLAPGALTDITAKPSRTVDLAGPVGPGWDAATGLGSFNAAPFIHDRLDQHLSLSPPAGPDGTEVLATASGFPPGEAISFSVGGGVATCTKTTDSTGTASCSLNVRWNPALGPQVGVDATDDLALMSARATFQASSTIPACEPSPSGYCTAAQAAQAAADAFLKQRAAGAPGCNKLGTPTYGVDAAYFAGMACGISAPGLNTYVDKDASGWHYLDARATQNLFMPEIGLPGTFHLSSGCANVRATPGLSGRVVACIGTGSGTSITVDGGPNYVDQKIWWHLQGLGWMAHELVICAGPSDGLLPANC